MFNGRLLEIACLALPVLVLTACGGGGGDNAQAPIVDNCNSTSLLENGACRTFATRLDERAPTPFVEDDLPVSLEVVIFQPLQGSRFPTLVFHHGSTGDGSDASRFGITFTSKAIASYFVEHGWMVVFPQRRGRGMSDGRYDEGFNADRSAYSCEEVPALAGAEHALEDLDVLTDWLRNRSDVDTTRMLVGGTSRGGILSVVHVARRPDVYLGAVNFVGGWLGEGCGDHRTVNE
ncbi:MAG: alpha/beta hydrolase family protein, partial [Woeseiaceae bacterium]